MQYQKFVDSVKERAGVNSEEKAVNLTRATLATLAERLAGNTAANLAANLPSEIGDLFKSDKSGDSSEGEEFDVQEFVRRVGERAQINDANTAALYASAVLAILQDAVPREDFDQMRDTFPVEYNALFEQENSEAMSTRY